MIAKFLALDPRFANHSDRKRVALELIAKAADSILAGDRDYPANWQRILDVCRQEVAGNSGAAPYLFWGVHND